MNSLIIRNEAGNPVCEVSYNEITRALDVVMNCPINLKINGDLGTEIDGECDLTVHGDMRIDTFLSKLFINSYISRYIKDNPDAIEKQKEIIEQNKNYDNWLKDNKEKILSHMNDFFSERIK